MQEKIFSRSAILPKNEFIQTAELVQNVRKLAKTFTVGHSEFLRIKNELSELAYKKRQVSNKKTCGMHRSVFAVSVEQLVQHTRFTRQFNKTVSVLIGMASALIVQRDIQRHFERANQKVAV